MNNLKLIFNPITTKLEFVNSNGKNETSMFKAGTFLQLHDTPETYLNKGCYIVKVKSDESGLEFKQDLTIPMAIALS